MAEKIGKYEIVERIGRGGMGLIYRARDPILERSVALKVISSSEITPDVRARFFREAQACARLSHPNIVTIYDMGEDEGRLFIVMELLEGDELRQLITRRPPLPLEDKLSIILQICDGLHYAHLKGVVHRDVKPANILLLRTGQVKILDFGIALMAATQGDLTRTGLILGTLRYMAPEQVRGRADHRSDIFSVGAVAYELLAERPPFTGDDPMQLLEQLRSDTPPPLSELDPSLPAELTAVVAQAMRKQPEERFTDLAAMRELIEPVQRALAEEGERARARVQRRREDLSALRRALAEEVRSGDESDAAPSSPLHERTRLATLQALELKIGEQIERVRDQLARVAALGPAIARGRELLAAGQLAGAVIEFEAVVAQIPGHVRATEGLAEARAGIEESRRRELANRLAADARAALDEGAPQLCLELLTQIAEISPDTHASPAIAALRKSAEAAVQQAEAARRAQERAERARGLMMSARARATSLDRALAPELRSEADAVAALGDAAFERADHAEAADSYESAAAAYQRFGDAARDAMARARAAAEQARAEAMTERGRARTHAPEHARESWENAERKNAEAEAARAALDWARAARVFADAAALYRRADDDAREVARARSEAERAHDVAASARITASVASAMRYAPERWQAAESAQVNATAAFDRGDYGTAHSAFAEARREYLAAAETAVVTGEAEARRADAMTADARRLLADGDVTGALRRADQALGLRPEHRAAAALRIEIEERVSRRQPELGSTAPQAPRVDDALGDTIAQSSFPGPSTADDVWRLADPVMSIEAPIAEPRVPRGRPIAVALAAAGVVAVIGALYWWPSAPRTSRPSEPTVATPSAPAPVPVPLQELRGAVDAARDEAVRAGAEQRAPSQFAAALKKAQEADLALEQRDLGTAQERYQEAIDAFRLAKAEPLPPAAPPLPKRDVARVEPRAAEPRGSSEVATAAPSGLRRDAEQARSQMSGARRAAEQVAAGFYAHKAFVAAQSKERDGLAALERGDYARAAETLAEAQSAYQAAASDARREKETDSRLAPVRATLDQAHAAVAAGRREAISAEADRLAKEAFERAQARQVEGDRLADQQDLAAAAQAYRDAADRYSQAVLQARAARSAR